MRIFAETLYELTNAQNLKEQENVRAGLLAFLSILYGMDNGSQFETNDFIIKKSADVYSLRWKTIASIDRFAQAVVFSFGEATYIKLDV